MRKIALINQKGGVGKTTTAVNLGAALAEAGRRVVLVDLDPQANLTLHLGLRLEPGTPTSYRVLVGDVPFADSLRPTETPGLSLVPTDIDLSGAELELASAFGRETLLREALAAWEAGGGGEADYVLFDCPPSLGLIAVNALAAADEVFLAVQTEFFALQGLSKLMEIVDLVRSRLHPELRVTGLVPCLYDSRLRLAREVLGELRNYFPEETFRQAIGTNIKLAEAPSFGQTILQYAPESAGARDYRALAREVLAMERAPAPAEPAAPSAEEAPPGATGGSHAATPSAGAPAVGSEPTVTLVPAAAPVGVVPPPPANAPAHASTPDPAPAVAPEPAERGGAPDEPRPASPGVVGPDSPGPGPPLGESRSSGT